MFTKVGGWSKKNKIMSTWFLNDTHGPQDTVANTKTQFASLDVRLRHNNKTFEILLQNEMKN